MQSRRWFLVCTGISVLLHLLVLWLVYRFPSTVRPPEEVMEIDLSDIPRSTDFLPAERGILQGRRPRPASPPPARKETVPPPAMQGRVPDLPVKTDLPPEKSFPVPARKAGPDTEPKDGREAKAESGPSPAAPRTAPGKSGGPPGAAPKSLRDLTPSLGRMVMTREEPSGGRGQGGAAGNAVGTGGKVTGEEGVTEEGGGGFRLTPLNAPEVQYISYFASIKRKIELVWQYPYEAAVAGIGGELILDFVIARSGAVDSIELIRGSGSKILDDEAIRSIRTASPFDPIPADYKIPKLQIRGRFVYVHGGALRLR
ncbi:energy transducer TonB [bacterium]|nr:energy transducer TonB [bacterium]